MPDSRLQAGNAVYEGGFVNDRMHGNGTITYPSGNTWSGQWRDGTKVEPEPEQLEQLDADADAAAGADAGVDGDAADKPEAAGAG